MGIRIKTDKVAKAKAALAASNNRDFTPVKRWSFPKKSNSVTLRFLGPWTEEGFFDGQPWRIVHQHWNVSATNKAPVVCKALTEGFDGEDCPICEFLEPLKAKKDDPAAQQTVKDMRAKPAYMFSIIDRDDDVYTKRDIKQWNDDRPDKECPFEVGDPKVQLYAANKTVFDAVVNFLDSGLDLMDDFDGCDVNISRSGSGLNTRYTVVPDFKSQHSPLFEEMVNLDEEDQADLVAKAKPYNLETSLYLQSYDDIKALLEGGDSSDEDYSDDEDDDRLALSKPAEDAEMSPEDLEAELMKQLGVV